MINIAFVTLHTPNIDHYASVTVPLMKKYCRNHGYEFIEYTECLDTYKHITWSKIKAIINVLKIDKYDWVFWADADSCPINQSKKLEDYLDNYDIIIDTQKEYFHSTPSKTYLAKANTGLWFIKNTEWSLMFLDNLYHNKKYSDWHLGVNPYHEQTAFSLSYNDNEFNAKEHIKHLDPYTMYDYNSFKKHFIHTFGHNNKCLLHSVKSHIRYEDKSNITNN